MTKAAQAFGKDVRKFFKTDETKLYMKALGKMGHIEPNIQKQATRGRNGATFGHPKLAVFFSRWLSPEFNVWCDLMIDNILRGNIQTTVVVPTLEAVAAPKYDPEAQPMQRRINPLILFDLTAVHRAIKQVQWWPSLTDRHPQGSPHRDPLQLRNHPHH